MNKVVSSFSLVVAFGLVLAPSAQAQFGWGSATLKTGAGDEITFKNGLFGNKTRVVKDRFGDKYVNKKGLLGNTDNEVGVLGNSYSKKKGIFGTKETEVSTLFGDSLKTKKNLFGYRTMQINAGGMSSLIGSAFHGMRTKPMQLQDPNAIPGTSSFGSRGLFNPGYNGSNTFASNGSNGFSPVNPAPQEVPLDAVPQSLGSQP